MGEQRKRKMVKRNAKVLSPERVGRITALFRAFDYDSGGSIDAVEFGFIGQQMDPKGWTDSKSDSIIKSLDKNDDGQISSSEFVEFFRKNGAQIRADENFNARQDKYLAAAVRGRAKYYFKIGAAARAAANESAPESFSVKPLNSRSPSSPRP